MKSCGGIFLRQTQTPEGLCALCGFPDASHMAVVLNRWTLPALFREAEGIGSERFLFRGRLTFDISLWRDVRGPRLEVSWRTIGGARFGALEDVSREADPRCDCGGDARFWQAWLRRKLGAWEDEVRERSQTVTFADLSREDVVLGILAAVPVFRRECEVHAGVGVRP